MKRKWDVVLLYDIPFWQVKKEGWMVKERKQSFKWGKYLIVIGIIILMFLFFQSVERKPLLADDHMVFVKAVVVQNDHEVQQAQASLDSGDTQEIVLIADFQMKSIGAMLGTIFGVIVSGLIALLFGHFGHVTGFNVDDIENLIYVGQNSRLDIGGMLFSGILIASLGAVMDVAMSVSTSLHEIKEQRPDITAKEIFKSGINIGRDMIGTMSNTLILAYAGGSLGLVMIIYAYSYQMHQILNMYSLAIEIMRGIAGTIGIILTVPITSLIMSVLLTRGGQKISTDKCK